MDARDLRDGYDRSAARYEERFAALQAPKLDAVLARVVPGARVLDVGCGTGFLAARVPHAVGIDISFEMLRRGRGVRVQADRNALPLRDASFDTVFAITCLIRGGPHPPAPHGPPYGMRDVMRALVEIHRVLRAGGVLAVTLLREDVPRDFERELRAAGFVTSERFECGQDIGWIAERI